MPIDRVPFYEFEQYASDDLNVMEAAIENALEELAGFSLRPPGLLPIGSGAGFDNQPAAAVLGGLNGAVSGTNLQVSPGLLCTTMTDTPDNPSVCGAYLAFNHATVSVPIPSPVADTWYIVAGRPALVPDAAVPVTTFDPPNRKLVSPTPSKVKRQRSSMLFTVVVCTGTDLSGSLPTNAVPLWGVFRPAGGGAINPGTQLVDLRPCKPSARAKVGAALPQNQWQYFNSLLSLNVHLQLDEVELYASSAQSQEFDPALLLDPTQTAPAANEWWYLYLARFRPLGELVVPRHAQPNLPGVSQQGLLILSKVAPFAGNTPDARLNSNALHAPAPFSQSPIAAGDAVCFGALRRNTGNTNWLRAQCDGDRVFLPVGPPDVVLTSTVSAPFTPDVPVGARVLEYEIGKDTSGSAAALQILSGTDVLWRSFPVADSGSGSSIPTGEFAFGLAATVPLTLTSTSAATFTLRLRGYRF